MNLALPPFLFLLVSVLGGCGGGSDSIVQENPLPPPTQQDIVNYSGAPPATVDVQNFKLAVWDNLATPERCGACHIQGQQSPSFARFDDINQAYSISNPLINLNNPALSLLVSKVAQGHNCWLSDNSACADIMVTWINAWKGDAQTATTVQLTAPTAVKPGASKNFPNDPSLFAETLYPILNTYCTQCHQSTASIPISPYIASSDIAEAYAAAINKINLDNPTQSRMVVKIQDEFHNCWTGDCVADGRTISDAIQQIANKIEITHVNPDLVVSDAVTLFDGTLASGGGRFEADLIAKWEFKTGSGNIAFDTSGVEPALDLTLSGTYNWVGGWGIQLNNGKAQGTTANSKKLHDLILATNEFSVEAWVAPANVTQEGPARIISYSGGRDRRNFTLGQTLYNYDFLLRQQNTDTDGQPALSTQDADQDLQAALQHVVINYSATEGRSIYVNGQYTIDEDVIEGGLLADWDDTFAFVLGNEVSGDRPFAGIFRMVAVHNRRLSESQIATNFDAGVGQKFYLLFGVSDIINITETYIAFEVSQFDSYSYLFSQPFLISLDANSNLDGIDIKGIRIGMNGREVSNGQQVFATLKATSNQANQTAEKGELLSSQGTIVQVQKGPEQDEFFLTFDLLGDARSRRVTAQAPITSLPIDLPEQADIGLKNFAEINATMALLTTVATSNNQVHSTYLTLRQQLPSVTNLDTFVASNQMAITQLAIKYCDQLIEQTVLRNSFFPDFNFDADPNTGLNQTQRGALIEPILERILLRPIIQGNGVELASQPSGALVSNELDDLIERLSLCSLTQSCTTDGNAVIAKAICAAVLGSAAVTVQ